MGVSLLALPNQYCIPAFFSPKTPIRSPLILSLMLVPSWRHRAREVIVAGLNTELRAESSLVAPTWLLIR